MSELLPCPYCGGEAQVEAAFLDTFNVMCLNEKCLATTGRASTEETAIAAWNRRTPDWRALAQELATHLRDCRKELLNLFYAQRDGATGDMETAIDRLAFLYESDGDNVMERVKAAGLEV